MKILMVLTSHDRLGDTGHWTGYWLDEFAAPYYLFKDAGAEVTVASPRGGAPPIDPKSDGPAGQTDAVRRLKADPEAQATLATTVHLHSLSVENFDAVFYPGGHGPLWDLSNFTPSIRLIQTMLEAGKPVAAVCHAPGVLQHVRTSDGRLFIEGRAATCGSTSARSITCGGGDTADPPTSPTSSPSAPATTPRCTSTFSSSP